MKRKINLKRPVENFRVKFKKNSGLALCFTLGLICLPMTGNAEENSPEQIVIQQSVQQNRRITGTVTDETGEGLAGASVVVKGTTVGTSADENGNFMLEVPNNAVLKITYLGYKAAEVTVGTQTNVNVSLEADNAMLDEVVVVGYGTMRRRDLTGAISSVKASDMEKVASSNAMQILQARVPGLDITQSDGQAGSSLSMTVRGNRSISASNDPLILVDGISYGSTLDINASDIESIEVLKDASSTAIYGTRGANGVIIVTTKRGSSSGKTRVNLNTYVSSNIPTSYARPLYGEREVQALIDKANYIADKASGNWGTANTTPAEVLNYTPDNLPVGQEFTALDVYNDGRYTNWFDYFLQNGLTQNYEASVIGGDEKTQFNVSLGAMFEQGLMKNDDLDRYNGKVALDHKISDYAKVGTSMLYTYRDRNQRNSSVFNQALKMTSITRPYNRDGSVVTTPNGFYKAHSSPLLDDVPGNYVNTTEETRFFGNAYAEINPFVKGLLFKSLFALDRSNSRIGKYDDMESVSRWQSPHTSNISLEYKTSTGFTWTNTLNYGITLGESEINALLGSESRQTVDESVIVSGDAGGEHYYGSSFYDVSKIGTQKPTSSYEKTSALSYFGRLNYVYAGKYILSATARRDGSSTLAAGHKWGTFPSVSAGWRIGEENFMGETKDWLSNLKFRVSWGVSGNAAVSAYQTLATLSSQDLYYWAGGKDIVGRIPNAMGNENLKWETTYATNFGLDFSFLNNRISGSIDYYLNNTRDLIFLQTSPASSVFTSVLANIGDSKGSGLEVALNTVIIRNKDFDYDINWSYSTQKDEITGLTSGVDKYQESGATWRIVGEPVSIYYDYEADGTWNVGEFADYKTAWEARHPGETMAYVTNYGAPGVLKVKDQNDDGKINEDDKIVYNRSPKQIFGMSNNFRYKNLALSILLYARLGGYMNYGLNTQIYFEPQWQNWGDLDYWTPDGKSHRFPSPGSLDYSSINNGEYKASLGYEKADYFKIKDITLSYNLPKTWLSKAKIGDVKIYGSLKNFFTFSSVGSYDSERGGETNFPLAKQAVIGLNIQF
ncbi:MAG: TonB-dependent receptor [Tannerella sp.]|jgi:TonB-linked SusC/RagA family outer membrane protein|nr:TonB-dependent receptor [Tannerella sp.]